MVVKSALFIDTLSEPKTVSDSHWKHTPFFKIPPITVDIDAMVQKIRKNQLTHLSMAQEILQNPVSSRLPFPTQAFIMGTSN